MSQVRSLNFVKKISKIVVIGVLVPLLQVAAPSSMLQNVQAATVETSTEGTQFNVSLPTVYFQNAGTASLAGYAGWRLYLSPTANGSATITWPDSTTTSVNLTAGQVTQQDVSSSFLAALQTTSDQSKVISISTTVPTSMYGCILSGYLSDCTNFSQHRPGILVTAYFMPPIMLPMLQSQQELQQQL
jgi:hypothetical protein